MAGITGSLLLSRIYTEIKYASTVHNNTHTNDETL